MRFTSWKPIHALCQAREGRLIWRPELVNVKRIFAGACWIVCLWHGGQAEVQANGIYRNGAGAKSMSMAGASIAWADGPIAAMAQNPAALSLLEGSKLEMSLTGARAHGDFENRADAGGGLTDPHGIVPDAAMAFRLYELPVTLGLGLIPEALLSADWRFADAPGGLDGAASYGSQQHHAEIIVVRSALGLGIQLGPKLSVGGSVGLIYNKNTLEGPYIFQTQPALRGLKTLLSLRTDGFGYNGQVGMLWKGHDRFQAGLAYTTETTVSSEGTASGNASAQLASLGGALAHARPDFLYDAEVINVFPQTVSGGLSWMPCSRWRVALQVDWLNWSGAFERLSIKLRNGNNSDLNALVGGPNAEDFVPLHWEDRLVYRAGLEWNVARHWQLRAGYSYGKSPVPNETLTAYTAAIMEHTLAAGVGFEKGNYEVHLGYQFNLPSERTVGSSRLLSGEYADTRVRVGIHWLGLSTGIRF